MGLRHHLKARRRLMTRAATVIMAGGLVAPVAVMAATPSTAGAAAVFYCVGPPPEAGAVVSLTFSTLNTVGAPADVSFSSLQQGLAAESGPLYNQTCIQQIPLPTP